MVRRLDRARVRNVHGLRIRHAEQLDELHPDDLSPAREIEKRLRQAHQAQAKSEAREEVTDG